MRKIFTDKNTNQIGLFGVVILISVIGLIQFTIPRYKEVVKKSQGVGAERLKASVLRQKLANIKSLSDGELSSLALVLTNAYPKKNEYRSLVNLVRQSSYLAGVSLANLELSPGLISTSSASGKIKQMQTARYQMEASGTLEGYRKYIEIIEKSVPLVNINEVSLEKQEKDGVSKYVSKLTFTNIFYPLPSKLPAVESPVETISPTERALVAKIMEYRSFYFDEASSIMTSDALPATPSSVVVGKEDPFAF